MSIMLYVYLALLLSDFLLIFIAMGLRKWESLEILVPCLGLFFIGFSSNFYTRIDFCKAVICAGLIP